MSKEPEEYKSDSYDIEENTFELNNINHEVNNSKAAITTREKKVEELMKSS